MSEQQEIKVKGFGDIIFAVDVTSSMTPCIDGLKEKLNSFLDELKELQQKKNLKETSFRLGLLTFKDCSVDKDPIKLYDFSAENDIEGFRKLLQDIKIEPYVGGDAPESVLEAFYVAANFAKWREIGKCHRIVALFTDNPCREDFNINVLKNIGYLKPGDENLPVSSFDEIITNIGQIYKVERIKTFIIAPEHKIWERFDQTFNRNLRILIKGTEMSKGLSAVDFEEVYKLLAKTISQ